MRGTIARALVAHGLHPSLGLFHVSEQNAFSLADIIEPFRPLIDMFIADLPIPDDEVPQTEIKAALINLLNKTSA